LLWKKRQKGISLRKGSKTSPRVRRSLLDKKIDMVSKRHFMK